MNGKVQYIEGNVELMELLVDYISEMSATSAREIVAPEEAVDFYELLWSSYGYDDYDYEDYYYGDYEEYETYTEASERTEEDYSFSFELNGVLTREEIYALEMNGIVKGNRNAPILILEFADVNCSYCKRQIADTKIVQTLMEKFPRTIRTAFRHMPVLGSYEEAQIIECVGDQSASPDYYQFIEQAFAKADGNVETLYALAKELGKDSEMVRSCVKNETFMDKIESQRAEGDRFEIWGTPSSVIINTRTGKYVVVAGAYPIEAFEEALKEVL